MMDCKQAMNVMQTALDAGLDTPPEAVRSHLEGCPECRFFWRETLAVERGLHDLGRAGQPVLPAGLHSRIMASLKQAAPAASMPQRRARPAWTGLAAASLLMLVYVGWQVPRHIVRRQPSRQGQAVFTSIPEAWHPNRLAALLKTPKQDLAELADSILATTDGFIEVSQFAPAPEATPATPTPHASSNL